MKGDQEAGHKPVALLLDCDDHMAQAFVEAGYKVERGATGFLDGKRNLPVALHNADVVVNDPHGSRHWYYGGEAVRYTGRYSESAWRCPRCWRGHDPEPFRSALAGDDMPGQGNGEHTAVHAALNDESIQDLTPNVRLSEVFAAVATGVPVICFVNGAVLARSDALALFRWIVPYLTVQPSSDPVDLCTADPPDVWGDFFRPARSPLIATMAAGGRLDRRRTADVQGVLRNRINQAHALIIREGEGAVFVLPEFEDNAAAAVRLVRDIWPKLRAATAREREQEQLRKEPLDGRKPAEEREPAQDSGLRGAHGGVGLTLLEYFKTAGKCDKAGDWRVGNVSLKSARNNLGHYMEKHGVVPVAGGGNPHDPWRFTLDDLRKMFPR